MALTQKKLGFAKALIAGKSNKDAAIAAGYSKATAAQAGSRLAKDADVKKHIAKLKQETKGGAVSAPPAAHKTEGRPNFGETNRRKKASTKAAEDAAREAQQRASRTHRRVAAARPRSAWGSIRRSRGGILLVPYGACRVFENRHEGKAASDAQATLAGIGQALLGKFITVRRGGRP